MWGHQCSEVKNFTMAFKSSGKGVLAPICKNHRTPMGPSGKCPQQMRPAKFELLENDLIVVSTLLQCRR